MVATQHHNGKSNGNGKNGAAKANPAIVQAALKQQEKNNAKQDAPKKRGRRTKAEIEADKAKAEQGKTAQAATATPAKPPVTAKTEQKQDESRFMAISMTTLTNALHQAIGFSKSALNLELAVGLAVLANQGDASTQSKKALYVVYGEAGYKCDTPEAEDYKTVSRRIGAAAALFDHIGGKNTVDQLMLGTSEMQSIQVIVNHLSTEFNFTGINSVMAAVGKPVILKRDREKAAGKSANASANRSEAMQGNQNAAGAHAGTGGQPSAENQNLADQIGAGVEANRGGDKNYGRRLTDTPNCHVIETEHLHLAIPFDVPAAELLDFSMQLMTLAQNAQIAEAS